MLTREQAKPLIEAAINAPDWVSYINFPRGTHLNIKRSIIERMQKHVPDAMDAMQAVSAHVFKRLNDSPIDLVGAPTGPNAWQGQIEVLLQNPYRGAWCIIYFNGEFWVSDQEFFPFE